MAEDPDVTGGLFPDLPIHARRCDPLSVSADCKQVCRASDNSEYAIKEAATFASMPHNEWLCAFLAESVGIPTPTCKIVEVKGQNTFGSRWQAGEETNWWLAVRAGRIDFDHLAPSLSRILAFDLFVNNGDRHLKNYFVFQQKNGHSVLAMDFGRAWLYGGFPMPALPMASSSNTVKGHRTIVRLFGKFIKEDETDAVLDGLRLVTPSQIAKIIDRHPKEWLKSGERTAILDWWDSNDRTDRIEGIKQGIKDGTFL